MAITNYIELQSAVANWMTRADLNARIPEFIELGEARLFTQLRVREMETNANVSILTSVRTSALPDRFVKTRALYITGSPDVRLEYRTPAEIWTVYSSIATAKPTYYGIEGDTFVWAPLPDAAYTAVSSHYTRPASFSSDTDTNDVIARWPNLYLYAALLEAGPLLKDDRLLADMAALFESLLDKAHEADKHDREPEQP